MPETGSSTLILVIYCVLVFLASLAGGWLILAINLTHTRLQVIISFVAGLMLGIALLHFLPDSIEQLHSANRAAIWMLSGFLAMFFVQRFFHFHHHDIPQGDPEDCCHEDSEPATPESLRAQAHDHDHDYDHVQDHDGRDHHDHEHQHAHTLAAKSAKQLSWVGTAVGLTLHSLFDGMALAAAVEAGAKDHLRLAGLGVALAVILHKPFDAMTVSTMMAANGKSKMSRHLLNGLFALVGPLGVVLFYLGAQHFADSNAAFLGCSLAFCSGTFLCIAGSDLLPELQFHSHDRLKLSVALAAGLIVTILVGQIEDSQKPSAPEKVHLEK